MRVRSPGDPGAETCGGEAAVGSWWSENPEACTEVTPLSENFSLVRRRGWKSGLFEAREQPSHANSPCCPEGGGKFRGNLHVGLIFWNLSSPPANLFGFLWHHPQMGGWALTMLGFFFRKKTRLSKKVMSLGCKTHLSRYFGRDCRRKCVLHPVTVLSARKRVDYGW